MTKLLSACAILIAALANTPAVAQNQVYDPLPPTGSAYVRFVNTFGEEVTVRPDFLPPQNLGTVPARRVTAYYVVEKVAGRPLLLEAQQGGQMIGRVTLHAAPGTFVTVILRQSAQGIEAASVVDGTEFNQTRARLAFYNAIPDCPAATLLLDPDGPVVFRDVAPDTANARSVNPVAAQVKAVCGARAVPAFPLEGLEAGGMYSIWLMLRDGSPIAFLTRDETARWRP